MYSNIKIRINCILLLVLCVYSCSRSRVCGSSRDDLPGAHSPKLLIVSYDGFRNEYFNRNITSHLNDLRFSGTYTDYVINVFPTKTFPNHHTIATGWYADRHGVTGNSVYDNRLKHKLNMTELFGYDANNVMPIWILNQKFGPNRYSGCMMWPGVENRYHNDTCHFIKSFAYNVTFENRVDHMMRWFTDPVTPINLGLLYIEEPDSSAHVYGPDSSQVNEVIRKLDNLTEYLENKLNDFGLKDVNVIYLSDHGMDTVLVQNIIDLNTIIQNDTYKYYGTSPVLQIVPNNDSQLESMYKALSFAAEENSNFMVYLNVDLPDQWHIRNDYRVGPITVVANQGYGFHDLLAKLKEYQKKNLLPNGTLPSHTLGIHGYDNTLPSMHSFFMARGPAIQEHHKIPPFKTLELFGLFCKILGIEDDTTDGDLVDDVMVTKETFEPYEDKILDGPNNLIIFGIAIICLGLILAGIGIRATVMKHKCCDGYIHNVSDDEKAVENQHLIVVNFSETED